MAIKERAQKEKQAIYNELQFQAGIQLSEEKKTLEKRIKELEKLQNNKNNLDRKLTVEEMREKDKILGGELKLNTIRVDPIEIIQPKPSAPLMNTKQPVLKHNVPVLNPEEERKRLIEIARQRLEDEKIQLKQTKERIQIKKEKKKKERFKNICTKESCKRYFLTGRQLIECSSWFIGVIILIALAIVLYIIAFHLINFVFLSVFFHPLLFVTEELNKFTKNDFYAIHTMKNLVNTSTSDYSLGGKNNPIPPPFNSYQNLPLSYESRVAIAWIPYTVILILVILYECIKNLEISKRVYGTRKYFLHITYLYRIQSFINWEDTKDLQETILAKYHNKMGCNTTGVSIWSKEVEEKKLKHIIKILKPSWLCFPLK